MRSRGPAVLLLAVMVACGGGATTEAQLNLVVRPGEDPAVFETALLVCGPQQIRGTGFLQPQADVVAACAALGRPAVRRVLLDPPAPNRACTQVFGGPQVATIVGTVEGQTVDVEISRADGCQIADWQTLLPLIGPATDDPAV